MSFQPEVGESIRLFGRRYTFPKHPAVVGIDIPYGQEGRQGTVYQIKEENTRTKAALKVFRDRFKNKNQVRLSEQLKNYSSFYGLSACLRSVIEEEEHARLVSQYGDLSYALIMPWIDGPTWADILMEEQALSKDTCLRIACMMAFLLKKLEGAGVAHCDLSSSNVMLPFLQESARPIFADIELIDIEELYAPELDEPKALPGGSPGYAANYVKDGIWSKEADRFAGAVLIAEMVSWHEDEVRSLKADDFSYFDTYEMQSESERYKKLKDVVGKTLGEKGEALFEQAWKSNSLQECPSFSQWYEAFPDSVKSFVMNSHKRYMASKKPSVPPGSMSLDILLQIAAAFEGLGNKKAAHSEYQYIMQQFPEQKAVVEELQMLLSDTEENSRPELVPSHYLEAAQHFEKLRDWNTALIFYTRCTQLPSVDFTTKEELSIIIEEIQNQIRAEAEQQSTAEKLKLIAREREQATAAALAEPLEAKKAEVRKFNGKVFFSRHWKWMAGTVAAICLGIGLYYLYEAAQEKKWHDYIQQGTEAFSERKYGEAEQYIQKAIDKRPTEDLYTKLATIYISQGQNQQAIQYMNDLKFKKELSSTNTEADYLMGRAYFLEKDYNAAIPYYTAAYKDKKNKYHQDAIRDLVVSYASINQLKKANALVEELQGKDSQSKAFAAYLKGDLATRQGKSTEAVDFFEQSVDLAPANKKYAKKLVEAYITNNKTNQTNDATKVKTYENAITLANGLLRDDYTNIDYLNMTGQLYYEYGLYAEDKKQKAKSQNLYKEALNSYNQVIGLGIQEKTTILNTGILYEKVGDKAKAEKTYKRVIKQNPIYGHAYFVYGMFQIKEKNYKKALPLLKKVIQINEDATDVSLAKQRIKEMKSKKVLI
ncbi:tetratricopeptide repeat protein [Fictibacillus fluitans]|uniref:Tetratricopeptide repeat protein n=1 Tax=Fictibacillus fluitans TaxID=3058422 RepID=A0ABT8I0D3_9BACL|nr:tetratricopeptide repeat protein [Fictibacillus sp. NE201]MDN4526482.1 tetratricopeptide repeat protein [Fictibacillus sp. NE201]